MGIITMREAGKMPHNRAIMFFVINNINNKANANFKIALIIVYKLNREDLRSD